MVPNDASLWTTKEALQMNTWHLQFVIEEFIILFICIRCDTFSYATRKKKNSRQKMNIELVFARILLIVLVLADFGVGFESSLSIGRRTKKPFVKDRTTELLNELLQNYNPTFRPGEPFFCCPPPEICLSAEYLY